MNPKQHTIDILDDLIKYAETSVNEAPATTGSHAAAQSAKLKETSTHQTVDETGEVNDTPNPDGGKTTFYGTTGVQASPTGENVETPAAAPGSDTKTASASDLVSIAAQLLESTESVVKRAAAYGDTKDADEPSDEEVSEEKPKTEEEKADTKEETNKMPPQLAEALEDKEEASDDSDDEDMSVEEKAAAYDQIVSDYEKAIGKAVGERTAALIKAAGSDELSDAEKVAADQAITARRNGEVAGIQLAQFLAGASQGYQEKLSMALDALPAEAMPAEAMPAEAMPAEAMPAEEELDEEALLALLMGLEEEGALEEELPIEEVAAEAPIEEVVEQEDSTKADEMAAESTEGEEVEEKIAALTMNQKVKLAKLLQNSI